MSSIVLAPDTTAGVTSPQRVNPKQTDDANTLAKDLLGVTLIPEMTMFLYTATIASTTNNLKRWFPIGSAYRKVGSLEFLQKLSGIQKSVGQNGVVEPDTSWDIITSVDLWKDGGSDDGYVLVKHEDVVDGMTSFMAACLVSIKKTKDLPLDQLQKALRKTFSAEKKKSKIRKAWDGTKVIYNDASWGATVVGVYSNRALLTIATTTFQTSCRVISKFL
ncbi:uncharacterized protein [Zea mays]|uniref:uncharacterized protein n=1 Tax=Zea mays TaxID=4577 RepID=UPI0009AAC178|nr:uncharacterized protein LOC109942654 [Zea mays]|eukprot:XP_020400370.1 uncharacterized protein LOC109942654 [Zea mays]